MQRKYKNRCLLILMNTPTNPRQELETTFSHGLFVEPGVPALVPAVPALVPAHNIPVALETSRPCHVPARSTRGRLTLRRARP